MVKRALAPYLPGRRSTARIKVKSGWRREFVVGGWAPGRGAGPRRCARWLDPVGVLAEADMQMVLGSRPSPGRVRQVW